MVVVTLRELFTGNFIGLKHFGDRHLLLFTGNFMGLKHCGDRHSVLAVYWLFRRIKMRWRSSLCAGSLLEIS